MATIRFSEESISGGKIGTAKIAGDRRETHQKRSKYGNEKTEVDGIKLDSRKEAKRWKELRLLLKTGHITWLARQVEFILPGGIIYRADFVFLSRGETEMEIQDVKGMITPEYRLKKKLMAERGFTVVET